eukprot:m.97236 g.97236  ORF g.97236 m.97236 type:complete len:58 (-) comp10204_c0_seq8:817-990(-)
MDNIEHARLIAQKRVPTTAEVESYFHTMAAAGLVADSRAYRVMIRVIARYAMCRKCL